VPPSAKISIDTSVDVWRRDRARGDPDFGPKLADRDRVQHRKNCLQAGIFCKL